MPTPTPETNITASHQRYFRALLSGKYSNFALFSCYVNGEPASAIVSVEKQPDGTFDIRPLFVTVTPSMVLADHEGNVASDPKEVN